MFNLISHLKSERSKWARYQVEHEKKNSVSTSNHVLCRLYKHTNDDVFDDFPMISAQFPKISEDSPKDFQKARRTFPKISEDYRRFLKITKDCQRYLRKTQWCFDHTSTHLSAIKGIYYVTIVMVIFSHVKITWKISCFCTKLTWYFIGVYIIIRFITENIFSLTKSIITPTTWQNWSQFNHQLFL